jgi:hypothetical protein
MKMGIGTRESCGQPFKALEVSIFSPNISHPYYVLWSITWSVQFISDICNRNTRQIYNLNLYQPSAHMSLYQTGVCYIGIKVFN